MEKRSKSREKKEKIGKEMDQRRKKIKMEINKKGRKNERRRVRSTGD